MPSFSSEIVDLLEADQVRLGERDLRGEAPGSQREVVSGDRASASVAAAKNSSSALARITGVRSAPRYWFRVITLIMSPPGHSRGGKYAEEQQSHQCDYE